MKQLTLLYLVRGNEVLLAMKKRGFGMGKWNGVGGKIDKDESVEQSMVRECQEEIDVTPLAYKPAGIMIFDEIFGAKREKVEIHVFICTEWNGKPTESEEMKPAWYPVHKLPFEKMWSADIHWLPAVLAGKTISAVFTLAENEEVQSHSLKETGRWH